MVSGSQHAPTALPPERAHGDPLSGRLGGFHNPYKPLAEEKNLLPLFENPTTILRLFSM
jgi:hypothetical protein